MESVNLYSLKTATITQGVSVVERRTMFCYLREQHPSLEASCWHRWGPCISLKRVASISQVAVLEQSQASCKLLESSIHFLRRRVGGPWHISVLLDKDGPYVTISRLPRRRAGQGRATCEHHLALKTSCWTGTGHMWASSVTHGIIQ